MILVVTVTGGYPRPLHTPHLPIYLQLGRQEFVGQPQEFGMENLRSHKLWITSDYQHLAIGTPHVEVPFNFTFKDLSLHKTLKKSSPFINTHVKEPLLVNRKASKKISAMSEFFLAPQLMNTPNFARPASTKSHTLPPSFRCRFFWRPIETRHAASFGILHTTSRPFGVVDLRQGNRKTMGVFGSEPKQHVVGSTWHKEKIGTLAGRRFAVCCGYCQSNHNSRSFI